MASEGRSQSRYCTVSIAQKLSHRGPSSYCTRGYTQVKNLLSATSVGRHLHIKVTWRLIKLCISSKCGRHKTVHLRTIVNKILLDWIAVKSNYFLCVKIRTFLLTPNIFQQVFWLFTHLGKEMIAIKHKEMRSKNHHVTITAIIM